MASPSRCVVLLKPSTNTLAVHMNYLIAELSPIFLWAIHICFLRVRSGFFLFAGRCLRVINVTASRSKIWVVVPPLSPLQLPSSLCLFEDTIQVLNEQLAGKCCIFHWGDTYRKWETAESGTVCCLLLPKTINNMRLYKAPAERSKDLTWNPGERY